MTTIGNNLQGPQLWGEQPIAPAPKTASTQSAEGPVKTGLESLSDEQLRQIAGGLQEANAGLSSLVDQFGGTAISLPEVDAPTDLGALSTDDLLMVIGAERRKTTELLLVATEQTIKNLQSQIDLKSKSSIDNLMKAAENQQEAQDKRSSMKALNIALTVAGAVAVVALVGAAFFTGGTTLILAAAISTAMFAAMTCLTQIKDSDGVAPMDKMMEGLAKEMTKLANSYGELPAAAKAAVLVLETAALVAASLLAPNPSLIASLATVLAMSVVASLPDKWCSDELKGQLMASTLMVGVMIAVSAGAAQAATSGVASSASSATSAATKLGAAAERAAILGTRASQINKAAEIVEGLGNVGQSALSIDVALHQFEADSARATVTALKAMTTMLQKLMEGDSQFMQMLAQVMANLDQGCNQVMADLSDSRERNSTEIYNYS